MFWNQLQSYLLLKLVGMPTLILHLHADLFQLFLRPSRHFVGCPALSSKVRKLDHKSIEFQAVWQTTSSVWSAWFGLLTWPPAPAAPPAVGSWPPRPWWRPWTCSLLSPPVRPVWPAGPCSGAPTAAVRSRSSAPRCAQRPTLWTECPPTGAIVSYPVENIMGGQEL